ncbi:CDP-glycerol glycerophosphotransferase (TagB/SpsB family) [Diaminobutyricimonas aerilata]|uniref:CDP-glycerol glycerophosphotransferase (TagB/SpsB family) n=1 Tax=Diaminobutyricimonas aerilata TaxID=1162967 RepID=A0A2M9CID4_9MICO|nr:CDP-glycerol glycerophosphotransferase family protein [Diaminobutyricimonas aerilata]PJJ71648.1 CDP-glycerol glycerophosphotransferase (TagB/SpsB family) [Diaminobutyricimonas aerilata]
MARFTFSAGNARKLVRLPLYGLGAVTTFLVPRSSRRWVVGSGIGVGEGALPLVRAVREHLPEVRVVWLAGDERELAEARAAGLEAAVKTSASGFRHTLRSKVLIVTHGFGDVNRYAVRGGFVVQLWHGIPLKRLHLDSPAALRVSFLPDHPLVRRLIARAYRTAGRQISLFPVASEPAARRIATAFGLPPERVRVTGDPRDDVLLRDTPAVRRERARDALASAVGELPDGAPVLLYAPTWRDGAPDPAVPTEAEWEAIGSALDELDAVLLVRSHPLGAGDYAVGADRFARIRMLGSDLLRDVTPVLPAVDVLITDYSSIAFDHALTDGSIVFFAPDAAQYATRRGLYRPYREFSGGHHHRDWAGTLDAVRAALSAPEDRHARRLADEHHDVRDGFATERVLAAILHGISEKLPATLPTPPEHPTARPEITAVEKRSDVPALVLHGRLNGRRPRTAAARGPRARVDGHLEVLDDGFRLEIPLRLSRWGSAPLPLPRGDYRLEFDDGEPLHRIRLLAAAPELHDEASRVEVVADDGGVVIRVAPPLADDERGRDAQRALERSYRRGRPTPRDAVFFESFYGQSASDNPRAIDAAIAQLSPGTRRYWSVVDLSVEVPDGATPILEGSREWWRVRGEARLLVVNDWLRKRYRPRAHQRVLQTWHGTMLKKLALDRPTSHWRQRIAVLRERARWDVLLAQNAYSERIFRRAYAFTGPIWCEGYPRNDVLATGDRAAVRRRLGVDADARVVLYAPTWRDDRTEMVDYVDLARFAAELDDDTVLLVRGHSRTLRYGRDLQGARLLDVTTYPDVADLLLATDVLVTDYSSVMFDWVATGRPIVFFTPDLAHYSEELRGFYFDLLAEAPGALTRTRAELLEGIRNAEAVAGEYAQRYAVWRERFTPHDDGGAAERIVRRLLADGTIG